MVIELTPEQVEQVNRASAPPTVHDPQTNLRYVLLTEDQYRYLMELGNADNAGSEGEAYEELDPDTRAAIEEAIRQSERGEGKPIEEVRREFQMRQGN